MQLICVGDIAIGHHSKLHNRWPRPRTTVGCTDTRILFNWEAPLGDAINPVPRARGPRILGARAGIRLVEGWAPGFAALANNHILDAGVNGLLETRLALRQAGFTPFGAGASESEIRKPLIWAGPEGSVGILNWVFPETHPEWMQIPGPNCWPGDEPAAHAIRALRQRVDWVIVTPHWSDECFPYPTVTERLIARRLVEAGADMVIGHHPHVVRGIEIINGKPVFYSLGNFYFSEMRDRQGKLVFRPVRRTREALVLRVTFSHGKQPEFETLSYWQGFQRTGPDRFNRAVRRMRKVSRPLRIHSEPAYAEWYAQSRKRFNRWTYRFQFAIREKGPKGILLYPIQLLKRHRAR